MPTMSDVHHLPLLGHDLPDSAFRNKARIYQDPDTGLWCWEHHCLHRLPGKPFYGPPLASWADVVRHAFMHVEFCP